MGLPRAVLGSISPRRNHCRCFGAECGLDYLIKMTLFSSAQQHRQLIHHLERGASLILMHFALSPGSTAQVILGTGSLEPNMRKK